jgi:dihydrofolate reductase
MVKYVVTSTPLQAQWHNSKVIQNNALDEITKLKQQPGQNILIEGSGTLVESLAQANLIDEYRILVHPSIAGGGKRFFKDRINLTLLKLVENKTLSRGVVALRYEPTRESNKK